MVYAFQAISALILSGTVDTYANKRQWLLWLRAHVALKIHIRTIVMLNIVDDVFVYYYSENILHRTYIVFITGLSSFVTFLYFKSTNICNFVVVVTRAVPIDAPQARFPSS